MSGRKQNSLLGAELKKLMAKNRLPAKYINQGNLNTLLEYEFEQMGENEFYDTKIIKYCSDLLAKKYADKNYKIRKQNTYNKLIEILNPSNKNPKKQKKFISRPIKKIVAIGIIAAITVSALTATAYNFNLFGNAVYLTKRMVSIIMGNEITQDDTNRGGIYSKRYDTLERFKKEENIDIITPTWLPNNTKTERIDYHDKEQRIDLLYDDDITFLVVRLNSAMFDDTDTAKIYEHNNIKFYVWLDSDTIWWEHDGDFYSLICGFNIKEDVGKIVENIK